MAKEPLAIPTNPLKQIQMFIDNGLVDKAEEFIKEWKLKIEIKNGQIVDISNTTEAWLKRFITANPVMMRLKDDVRKLSKCPYEVLIIGPTGTGKELLAKALHGDRDGRFIALNCAGLPKELVESELFGHVRGAFTGAVEPKRGLLSLANEGTIFLDEIGDLPLDLQAKLLRALQEKKIRKVGGDKEEEINCRVVCATHKDIKNMTKMETFRVDLFARISTFTIETLSLKQRQEDIQPIILSLDGGKEFLDEWNKLTHLDTKWSFDLSLNVRSLQQHVLRYKVLHKLPINPIDIPKLV